MDIQLALTADPRRHLEGTVTLAGTPDTLAFSGAMELLARIEQLADRHQIEETAFGP
jgi:hypothetical protein